MKIRPDRLTIWPTEDGDYGLDVRWGGPGGIGQATTVRDACRTSGLTARLSQDVDGSGWTVRVGPLVRDEITHVLQAFLV